MQKLKKHIIKNVKVEECDEENTVIISVDPMYSEEHEPLNWKSGRTFKEERRFDNAKDITTDQKLIK